MDKAKLKASFEKHTSNPDVSIDEYVQTRRRELGRSIEQHKLIYLDMRYWIILRDVLLERRNDASSVGLLDNLRFHAERNEIICPISGPVFVELLKQQDPSTRRKTAELIDELSFGVALGPEEERVGTEFAHFFHSYRKGSSVYPLDWLIWSKLSCVFGDMYPTNTGLNPGQELVMQKVYFDQMWDRSLTEILDTLKDSQPPESGFKALATRLNEGNAGQASEIQSFKQAYEGEIEGCLSLCMSVAREIEEKFKSSKGVTPRISDIDQKERERQLLGLFMQAFRKIPEMSKLLPTLHIHALCLASIRWDKSRKLKGNDFYDFDHAAAAVPYCDVFLTEIPLQKMLEQKHLKINQDFDCKIISSISEAVEFLEKV